MGIAQISSYYLNCKACGCTLLFYYTFVITRATASTLFYNIDASRPNNTINPIMYAEELARPCILLQRHYISAVYAAEASIFGLLSKRIGSQLAAN